jgi:hypothetical protein
MTAETTILVGPPGHRPPFILPTRQLCLYSPYLRTLIGTSSPSLPIDLPHDDPVAFDVLVSWMNYAPAPKPCHQSGVHLEKKIKIKDNEGIPLAFKVWVLTHRLGGACLVLSDACMRYSYQEYTRPSPENEKVVITPAIALYVFLNTRNASELRQFVLECITRQEMQKHSTHEMRSWEVVFERVPTFKTFMEQVADWTREGRMCLLSGPETYMCTSREIVIPDFHS